MITEKHPFAMTTENKSSFRRCRRGFFKRRDKTSSKLDLESYISSMHSNCSLKSCMSTGSSSRKLKRHVSFDRIEIREYERALSDNPAVTSGPALGLSWNHGPNQQVDVDDYESARKPCRMSSFQLDKQKRESILRESGVSAEEMQRATRDAYLAKCRRRATMATSASAEKREQVMEAASRKMRRLLSLQNKAKEMDKLWQTAQDYTIQNTPPVQLPKESRNDLPVPTKVTMQFSGGDLLLEKLSLSDDDDCDDDLFGSEEYLFPPEVLVHPEPMKKEKSPESGCGREEEVSGEDTNEH